MQHVCLRNEKSSPILLLFSFCPKCQANQETPKHLFWSKTFLYGHMKILNQFHKSHPYFGASKLSIELIAKTSPYSQHLIKLRKNQVWVANDITFRCYLLAQMVDEVVSEDTQSIVGQALVDAERERLEKVEALRKKSLRTLKTKVFNG